MWTKSNHSLVRAKPRKENIRVRVLTKNFENSTMDKPVDVRPFLQHLEAHLMCNEAMITEEIKNSLCSHITFVCTNAKDFYNIDLDNEYIPSHYSSSSSLIIDNEQEEEPQPVEDAQYTPRQRLIQQIMSTLHKIVDDDNGREIQVIKWNNFKIQSLNGVAAILHVPFNVVRSWYGPQE